LTAWDDPGWSFSYLPSGRSPLEVLAAMLGFFSTNGGTFFSGLFLPTQVIRAKSTQIFLVRLPD